MDQTIEAKEPGLIEIERHKIYPPSAFDGNRLRRFDEHYPAIPFQRAETAMVVCAEKDPADSGSLPMLCRQRIRLWLKDGAKLEAIWSPFDREPELRLIHAGCVVIAAPLQIDAPAIQIHSSPGAGASAPRPQTTQGKLIASGNVGRFRIYCGDVQVRDLEGRPFPTPMGEPRTVDGFKRRTYVFDEDLERTHRVAPHRLWVHVDVVNGSTLRDGGVLLPKYEPATAYHPEDWASHFLDRAHGVLDGLTPYLNPSMFDRFQSLEEVHGQIDKHRLRWTGELVESYVLPQLVPGKLSASPIVRLAKALRERLGGAS